MCGQIFVENNGKEGEEYRAWLECETCHEKGKECTNDEDAFLDIVNWTK